jgi:hypothetical protein
MLDIYILLYKVAMMAQKWMILYVPGREQGCFASKGCKDQGVCLSSALAAELEASFVQTWSYWGEVSGFGKN